MTVEPHTPTESPTAESDAGQQMPGEQSAEAFANEGQSEQLSSGQPSPSETEATASGDAEPGAQAPPVAAEHESVNVSMAEEPSVELSVETSAEAQTVAGAETPPEGQTVAEGGAGPNGSGPKKKRKRKKKKKPSGDKSPHAPFSLVIAASPYKKHGFSAGEVVAGRVSSVSEDAFCVDLFGKAIAVVDVFEPREIPPELMLTAEQQAHEESLAAEKAAEGPTAESSAGESEPTAAQTSPSSDAASAAAEAQPLSATPQESQEADLAEVSTDVTIDAAGTHDAAPAEVAGVPEGAASQSANSDSGTLEEGSSEGDPATHEAPAQAATEGGHAGDNKATGDGEATAEPTPSGPAQKPGLPADFDPATFEPAPLAEEAFRPTIGDIFRGRIGAVSESGHMAVVHRVVESPKVEARLEWLRTRGERVRGLVFGFNRGGFDIIVEGTRAFCPAAAMSLEPIPDPMPYVGQRMEFTVSPPRPGGHGVVVGRRSILEKELRRAAKERLGELEPGQKLSGTVSEVRDYGVLVDIGGAQGLVHLSELGWQRGVKPQDVVQLGQQVDVQVLNIQPPNKKDRVGRVSLSMKAVMEDPLKTHSDKVFEGAALKGKVTRTTDFGAFVEVAPGVEGLLHITELGTGLKHADQAVKTDEELVVVVDRVDKKNRRLSLSRLDESQVKAFEEGTLELKRQVSLKPGSRVQLVITKVDHKGLQVTVDGVAGKRGRGFLPNRELGNLSADARRKLQQGTTLDAKITGHDRDGSLRLSVRALELDDERRAVKEYRKEASKQGLGTFGDLLKSKLSTPDK